MKYWELEDRLRKKEIAPVYFFSGEENFLKEEALKQIKQIVLLPRGNTGANFNYDLFYADDCDLQVLFRQADTLPLFAPKRLIVLKRVEKLSSGELLALSKYIENPFPATCLVLVASGRVNLKEDVFAQISQKCLSVVFWKLFDNQIPGWIIRRVNREGKRITHQAAEYLQQKVGSNLGQLNSEIEKITVYLKDQQQIGIGDIQSSTGELKANTVFDLERAIYRRDPPETIKILNNLIASGEKGEKISFRIIKSFEKLLAGNLLQQAGKSSDEIMQILGIKVFFNRDFPLWLRNFQTEELIEKSKLVAETDFQIKTGKAKIPLALELLLLRLLEKDTTDFTD